MLILELLRVGGAVPLKQIELVKFPFYEFLAVHN